MDLLSAWRSRIEFSRGVACVSASGARRETGGATLASCKAGPATLNRVRCPDDDA